MSFFHFLSGLFIPAAYAMSIDNFGTANAGVSSMWADICSTVPFCDIGNTAPTVLGLKIVNFILQMIGGVAVAVLIYAGIKMIISHGNDEGLSDAKKISLYAGLGLIFAMIADAVVQYGINIIEAAAG